MMINDCTESIWKQVVSFLIAKIGCVEIQVIETSWLSNTGKVKFSTKSSEAM